MRSIKILNKLMDHSGLEKIYPCAARFVIDEPKTTKNINDFYNGNNDTIIINVKMFTNLSPRNWNYDSLHDYLWDNCNIDYAWLEHHLIPESLMFDMVFAVDNVRVDLQIYDNKNGVIKKYEKSNY